MKRLRAATHPKAYLANVRKVVGGPNQIGYMDYGEVKKYAAAYELQQQYLRIQDRLLEVWTPLLNAAHGGDIERQSERELLEWRQQILTALSFLQVRDSLGKSLSDNYGRLLATDTVR